jgi:predicted CoA-binding protein
MTDQPPERTIEQILKESKTIAVVGLSANPGRDSHQVASYLKRNGYIIYPVNPNYEQVLGSRCYTNLSDIPDAIDIVDIFRRPEYIPPIAGEAVKIGAKVIWMQLGIRNEEAAETARRAGLQVIMDRCIKIEHQRLLR